MSKEAMKLAQFWQQTDWNTESPMSADFAVSEANDVISALMDALREALAEQPAQQESDAVHQFRSPHCSDWYDGVPDHHDGHGPYEVRTLYTSPQPTQRTWVGLTDEDFQAICKNFRITHGGWIDMLALEIEEKLKEKNT